MSSYVIFLAIIVSITILELFGLLPIAIGIPASLIILVCYIAYLLSVRKKQCQVY